MILRPDFYAPAPHDRRARRQQLGLDVDATTAVVMFGGQGSTTMLRIATQLHDVPLILLCGHNARLANTLRALPAAAPRVVVEHTADVAHYMRLGDFLIGKPGPGCISEALQCGLPVIVARNAWTLPQERFNTDWVREQGVGLVLKSFGTIREAVAELRARLPEFSANVHKEQNRALFELPEIFDDLLDISSTACPLRPEQFEVGALGTV
jgi:1,2-diacylglycerol 3-beta-galactosyltransferase